MLKVGRNNDKGVVRWNVLLEALVSLCPEWLQTNTGREFILGISEA